MLRARLGLSTEKIAYGSARKAHNHNNRNRVYFCTTSLRSTMTSQLNAYPKHNPSTAARSFFTDTQMIRTITTLLSFSLVLINKYP
jgi:hypothetical protein